MTPPASTICCAGCGYVAGPADPYPFRCPRAGTDDADHVLTRVLDHAQATGVTPLAAAGELAQRWLSAASAATRTE